MFNTGRSDQTIKLDASFVRGLPSSQECTSIVEAVVGLAHSLDLTVVAEGVERPEQAACLEELGCDQIQGFLIAKALPPDEIEALFGACLLPKDEGGVSTRPGSESSSRRT